METKITETEAQARINQPPAIVMSDEAAMLVHKNYTKHDIEWLLPNRMRKRDCFETTDLQSFDDYINQNKPVDSPTQIYVSKARLSARAILNAGTLDEPGHCDDTAIFNLVKTDLWAEISNQLKREFNQRSFANLLEDHAHALELITSTGDELPTPKAIAAISSMDIEQARSIKSTVGNMAESRSVFESTEAKNAESIPAYIRIHNPCYEGLSPRDVQLRIVIRTGGSKPEFVLQQVGAVAMHEGVVKDFVEMLKSALSDSSVFVGTFATN